MRFPGLGVGIHQHQGASRRILANTFYLLAAEVTSKLLSLGFFVIAARHMGVELFGVFSFAVAYVTVFGVLADLGLALYVAREVARRPGDAGILVGNAVILRFSASVAVAVLIVLSGFVAGFPAETRGVLAIFSILVVVNGLFLLMTGVFQGFERNYFTALGRVVQTIMLLVGAVILLRFPPRIGPFSWLFAGAAAVSAAVTYVVMVARVVRPALHWRPGALLGMLRSALPMGISAVLVTAYYWNGSALLASMAGERAVGVFAAPHRLVMGMAVLGMAFSGAMYPHMSRVFSEGRERLPGILGRALHYMSLTAVPLAILGVMMAAEAIGVVYGADYAESAPVLRVLALWGCGTYYNSLLANYYYSVNRARFATAQAAVSLAVNVAANFLLIPRYGALGAALALAGAEFAGTVWLTAGAVREWSLTDRRRLSRGAARCLAAALIAGVLGRAAALINAPVALAVACLSYLLFLIVLGGVSREDSLSLKALLTQRG